MKIPFISKLSDSDKNCVTLIAGFCGIIVLITCILFICGWYTAHIGYLLTPILITLLFVIPLNFNKKLAQKPVLYRNLLYLYNTVIIYFYIESITRYIAPDRVFCFQFPIGLILTYCIYAICGALSGKFTFSLIFSNFLFSAVCISNKAIADVRGRPLFISDFSSFRTAMNVSTSYSIPVFKYVFYFSIFASITAFSIMLAKQAKADIERIKPQGRIVGAVFFAVVIALSYGTNLYKDLGIELTYWSHQNGILLDWLMESKDFRVKRPEGYSSTNVMAANNVFKPVDHLEDYNGTKPNIIVIMNESFSDLSAFAPFNTDIDYMPFLHSADNGSQPDMITGNLYTSVYGGNTANSEYEFLTGDSIVLYPQNSVPYQTFLNGKGEIIGLPIQLKKMGYTATAMHPYWASGWNRRNIYSYMGFDAQYYLDDMSNIDYIRSYCSDSCDYRNVIDLFENRDKDKPFFLFNVTMQNHGGYTNDSYSATVHLTDYPGQFPQTEQYLSLIRESDKALVELITYFRNVDEPTVIVFFGDHQPSVETGFYEALCGKSFSQFSDEENFRMYITKYMVWKNFDTEYFHIGDTSLNYFATRVLEMIGLPTTSYQNYLMDMRKNYPIISTAGVIDSNGNYIPAEKADLSFYKIIVYNHMLDNENYRREFFENDYEIDNDYFVEDY